VQQKMLNVSIGKRLYVLAFVVMTIFFRSIAPQSTGIWELSLIQPLVYTAEICFEEIVEEKRA
jgi:hypothetical protein